MCPQIWAERHRPLRLPAARSLKPAGRVPVCPLSAEGFKPSRQSTGHPWRAREGAPVRGLEEGFRPWGENSGGD